MHTVKWKSSKRQTANQPTNNLSNRDDDVLSYHFCCNLLVNLGSPNWWDYVTTHKHIQLYLNEMCHIHTVCFFLFFCGFPFLDTLSILFSQFLLFYFVLRLLISHLTSMCSFYLPFTSFMYFLFAYAEFIKTTFRFFFLSEKGYLFSWIEWCSYSTVLCSSIRISNIHEQDDALMMRRIANEENIEWRRKKRKRWWRIS